MVREVFHGDPRETLLASTTPTAPFALARTRRFHETPRPVRPSPSYTPLTLRCCVTFCALAALGCQPVQIVQPAVPGQLPPQQLFAAPPVTSAEGMLVDPFTGDPSAVPFTGEPAVGVVPGGPSQIHVPVANRDWTWEQIVDATDDYFRIERERQVQLVGDILTEGRIDVFPRVGATIVEPHRRDSVGRYNRWESTFQTIRRRCVVRVIPDATGYLIDVTVEKDIENLPHPENATAGAATLRNDASIPSNREEPVNPVRLAGNWILLGRDPALEQRMLADIQGRLTPQPANATVAN